MENFNLILTKRISDEVRNVLQIDEQLHLELIELLEEPLRIKLSNELDGSMFLQIKRQMEDGKSQRHYPRNVGSIRSKKY